MTKDPKYAHQAHLEVVKNRNTRWLPCPDTDTHRDTDGAIITIHPVGHAVTPATHSLFRRWPVVDAGACDHTQPYKNRQHRRSAIGDQRQGRADNRQQTPPTTPVKTFFARLFSHGLFGTKDYTRINYAKAVQAPDGIIRLYYRCFKSSVYCYAESTDHGLTFTKPNLGQTRMKKNGIWTRI